MVTTVQVMAHYSNEYYDLGGDRLIAEKRTFFSGGRGILPSGLFPPVVALNAARLCGVIALIAIGLATSVHPIAGLIGLLVLLVS